MPSSGEPESYTITSTSKREPSMWTLEGNCSPKCLRTSLPNRCLFLKWRYKCLVIVIIFILLFWFANTVVIPNNMARYWNDPCLTPEPILKDLRQLLLLVVQFYEVTNQTYWLDYGTLLGAYRQGDILPHDGDVDVSRLIPPSFTDQEETKFMHKLGHWMHRKLPTASFVRDHSIVYKSVVVDLARWRITKATKLRRYFTDIDRGPVMMKFLREEVPIQFVLPTQPIRFNNRMVSGPSDVKALLTFRYPYTGIKKTRPYKWRCLWASL